VKWRICECSEWSVRKCLSRKRKKKYKEPKKIIKKVRKNGMNGTRKVSICKYANGARGKYQFIEYFPV
jgi:hypothetical protein